MAIPKTVPKTEVFEGFLVLTPVDNDLEQALLHANHSPDAAFRCLELLCAFINALQPVPDELRNRLTRAVKYAGNVKNDRDFRSQLFLQCLGLSHIGRPAKGSVIEIGEWLRKRPQGESRTQAVKAAAEHFGMKQTTIRSYRDAYEEAYELAVQHSPDGQWKD